MRVAMYYSNSDIRIEEMAVPEIGDGELLVRITASGICGSDVMEWYRRDKVPLVLGHEIAGEVAAVGAGVMNFSPGDRVTATHHVPCGSCHYCLTGHETMCPTLLSGTHFDPGGFCEYVRLAPINVEKGTWRLPPQVSDEAATFVEPLACVIRGQRRAGIRPGGSVLVLGCGISGLLHVHLAAHTGAGLIAATDISPYRLERAREFGATLAMDAREPVAERFRAANHGRGAETVIICASATAAFIQALECVDAGGTILIFAPTMEGVELALAVNKVFWRRDVTMTTTYAGAPADCVAALEMIAAGRLRVEEMITHRLGLADTVDGSKLVAAGGESLKVIIHPQK